MTIEEYQEKLRELAGVSAEELAQEIVVPEGSLLLGRIKNRIQVDGKGSDGSDIGQYSKKPAYYSRDQFDKKGSFRNVGKEGKPTKSTMYFPDGYYGLRGSQDKPNNKINETYTGSTLLSYQLEPISNGAQIGFVNEQSSKIRKGQEQRRGKIFYATEAEMKEYEKNVAEASAEVTLRILNA